MVCLVALNMAQWRSICFDPTMSRTSCRKAGGEGSGWGLKSCVSVLHKCYAQFEITHRLAGLELDCATPELPFQAVWDLPRIMASVALNYRTTLASKNQCPASKATEQSFFWSLRSVYKPIRVQLGRVGGISQTVYINYLVYINLHGKAVTR